MSDNGNNLGMLIAAFDHKAAEIEQQNNQALLDIQAASQKLEALRRDQAQATSQLATSRQTMAKLPASDAQHPELQNSIQSLEQKQQARAAEISAQAQALQRLNDAQKLEAAQHRLRREQSAFIVQVDAALARIADGAIRYLFATRALAACEARKITPDIFDDVPSQKIIADVLGKLENAKSRATEAERKDAAIYSKLVAMQSDTSRYLQTFLGRVADNEAKKSQIAAGQKAAEDAISALSRPETSGAEIIAAFPSRDCNGRRRPGRRRRRHGASRRLGLWPAGRRHPGRCRPGVLLVRLDRDRSLSRTEPGIEPDTACKPEGGSRQFEFTNRRPRPGSAECGFDLCATTRAIRHILSSAGRTASGGYKGAQRNRSARDRQLERTALGDQAAGLCMVGSGRGIALSPPG